jgi:hypothetical protein
MTKTRKIGVVILTVGLVLFFVGYCMHGVAADERARLRDDLLTADYLHRPLAVANAELALPRIRSDEQAAGGVSAVGALIGIVGIVMLIIGGSTRQTQDESGPWSMPKPAVHNIVGKEIR